jgi:malate dehydrogenase
MVLGQHGDHLVPIWSSIQVQGIAAEDLSAGIERIRRGRHLRDLPQEVPAERAAMVDLIAQGRIHDAYERVKALPVDLRVAVKPFFTAFTSGRTTEIVTAHAAVDIVAAIVNGTAMSLPAQVVSGGVWNNIAAPLATPVLLGVHGWQQVLQLGLAEDELAALGVADAAVTASIRAVLG